MFTYFPIHLQFRSPLPFNAKLLKEKGEKFIHTDKEYTEVILHIIELKKGAFFTISPVLYKTVAILFRLGRTTPTVLMLGS